MKPALSKREAEVLAYLLERLPVEKVADISRLTLQSGSGGPYRYAVMQDSANPQRKVVATIPATTDRCYITSSGLAEKEAGRLLANLVEMDEEGSGLSDGCRMRLLDSVLESNGLIGLVLLPPSTMFGDVEATVVLPTATVKFSAVKFLSEAEYRAAGA